MEARQSAESAKAVMRTLPIALITDEAMEPSPPFDLIVHHEEHAGTKRFKQSMGNLSRFGRTLLETLGHECRAGPPGGVHRA